MKKNCASIWLFTKNNNLSNESPLLLVAPSTPESPLPPPKKNSYATW